MVTLYINGEEISTSADCDLLTFLRRDMGIKSVKDGCNEGACGTCKVLIDGAAKNACMQKMQKLEGKSILTVDGFSQYEKDVYVHCFTKAGAVQCGFCIPGMVICAKGLLDKNPNPTEKEIAKALVGNICRCTGYKKIIEAIQLAAKMIREQRVIPPLSDAQRISQDVLTFPLP